MNPFYFEIVRGRTHRYSWQLVTYSGGDRRLIAKSSRDWHTADEARASAEATKQAVCDARVVTKPAQPGDIQFEVIEDVLALEVTGHGDFDTGHDHDRERDGNGDRPATTVTPAKQTPAPVARAEDGKSNGEARPKARPRKAPAKATRAGASRS
ncbi:hypothetical protein ACFY36_16030 [Actinoplanes sp. NPDC000266]